MDPGWILVGGVLLLLIFRPKSITDIARSLGQVASELRGQQRIERSREEMVLEIAEKMGIRTGGKTTDQIREEILKRANRNGP
jgi:Sec-independent protein translocase protein TatA